MNIALIIPSRYGSTRLKGKPLRLVSGKTLIYRVWSLASAVKGVNSIHVATDDRRIADHVEGFGGLATMTPERCENGTERVFAAAKSLSPVPSHVLNLQGDAVLTPPWVLERVVEEMVRQPDLEMVTAAVRMDWRSYQKAVEDMASGEAGATTVVFDRHGNALYFTKGVIPFVRRDSPSFSTEGAPVYQHVGIYGYKFETLTHYLTLKPGPLERAEKLEQLRALENGIPLRVVEVDYRGRTNGSIDIEDDICRAENIISSEGELLDAEL
ncbi:3-deoxy-manno-octulosonate cytidylyltransferase [Sinorhizobium sp. 8-89]|uniref:3-deoxy-manno-octulosonate cytidylyltransferase n=1 Tax=Sinorhizobium sp. 7-81 TaxID=3049087 RepID=UPI0024C365F8|nr:3-deoxy-manno-octulosonate cytidylyltransferase [Sinorhizobium sp. 7-81]MDK1389816.1 3-deoxy-manno-octulosonate cytidylyltransferase [Sinorhizobium sp. 7-81]